MESHEHGKDVASLVRAARAGDRKAGEELFRSFAPMALRAAMVLTRGRSAEAEDLVQDVFVACLSKLDDLREPAHFGAWMLRSLTNRAINSGASERARARVVEAVGRGFDEVDPSHPLDRIIDRQRITCIRATFAAMEEGPIKETARLYYFDGPDDAAAIAMRLGVSTSTITTRLDRFP